MLPTVISKIERGERRIDVDDLIALAVALDISPLALLLRTDGSSADACELTDSFLAPSARVWEWADGERPLEVSETDRYGHTLRFRLDSRPVWDRSPQRAQYNAVLSEAVERLVLAGQQGRVEYTPDGTLTWFDEGGRVVRRWHQEEDTSAQE